MPFPVQWGRFATQVRSLFGIQGHVGLQAIDDVFPTVPLASAEDPALLALRGEVRCAIGVAVAAVAGQFGFVYLHTPFTADRIVTVEEVWVHSAAANPAGEFRAQLYRVGGIEATDLSPTLDTRTALKPTGFQGPAGVGVTSGTEAVIGIGRTFFGEYGPGNPFVFRPNAVLAPDGPNTTARFQVSSEEVNTALHVTLIFRSRAIGAQERLLG